MSSKSSPDNTPRCTAKNSRGTQCKRRPIVGGTVCPTHGGSAPQVRAAAERRQLVAAANRVVQDLWAGLDQATPVKDPVASLERMAGALEQAVDEAGRRVSVVTSLAGGEHMTQLRAEAVLFERLLSQLRQTLVDMARLGIAERHVQLEQERAQLVVAAFLAALDVGGLVPEIRSRMIDRFLTGLGDLVPPSPPALEAGGAA